MSSTVQMPCALCNKGDFIGQAAQLRQERDEALVKVDELQREFGRGEGG